MTVRIPQEQRSTIKALLALDEAHFAQIKDQLERARPDADPEQLASKLDFTGVEGAPPPDDLVSLLLSLYTTYDKSDSTLDRFLDRIRPAIAEIAQDVDKTAPGRILTFFRDALQMDETLGTTAKGLSIWYDRPNTYCESRVISDIRPVFAHDIDVTPHAFMVSHTLRVTVHKTRELDTHDLHIVCAKQDLIKLQAQITRALQKDETLSSAVKKVGGDVLGPRGHNDTEREAEESG